MKKITSFLLMFVGVFAFSQNNPINFEPSGFGADWSWNVFENAANPPVLIIENPDPTGANTSANVMRFEALQAGQPFAGCESANTGTVGPFLWDSSNRSVRVKVWKPVISDVGIKFATATGWSQGEIKVANTLVNQWEELTFNFSGQGNPPSSEGELSQIIIFPDFNARTQTNVCYIDEITFGEALATPNQPAGFVASNTIGPNPVGNGEVFLACGPNNVGGDIVYRLFYAPASTTITNPIAQATAHTFGTIGGDGGGTNAFGFVIGGLEQGTSYNFWLYQYNTVADVYSTAATATATSGGQSVGDQLTLPLTFESTTLTYSFTDFGGAVTTKIANPDPSGANTSANVAQYTKNGGSETWAGSFITLGAPIDFSNSQAIKVKTWSPTAGTTVRLKLENSSNSNIFVETDAVTTVANAWEELTFSYPGIVSANNYQNVVIFFNFGTSGTGENYYFDDVATVVTEVEQVELPLDFESSTLVYTFTDFGGAVTTKIANPDQSGANTSANVAQYTKNVGSETWAGSFITLGAPIDFSNSQAIKVKTWSPTAGTTVRLKLENATNSNIFVETDAVTTVANAWEELTFSFPGIVSANNYQNVVLFFNFGTSGTGENYYFDDVATVVTEVEQVELPLDFESSTLVYTFSDFGGAVTTKIANPDQSGANTSANVAQYVKNPGSEIWAGSFITLGAPIDFSGSQGIRIKTWSPTAGITVRLKLENTNDSGIFVETDAVTTVANAWEELIFSFPGIVSSANYQRVVLFFNFGVNGAGESYFFDDIALYSDLSVSDSFDAGLRIAPNPTQNLMNISTVNPIDSVEIYSITGQLVKAFETSLNSIDVSDLNTGVYIARFYNGSNVAIRRIVKK